MKHRVLGAAALCATLCGVSFAGAHLTLTSPVPRHPDDDLKFGPCGVGSPDARSTDPNKITTFNAGETITITWIETVDHDPSHYRVAFSQEGDSFVDPTGYDDIRSGYPILLDGIEDADAGSGHEYSVQVTLPNEPCDACTLQVIQVMHDKPPWGTGGGEDIYYQCADITLVPVSDGDPGAGQGGTTTDPNSGGGQANGLPDYPLAGESGGSTQQGSGSDEPSGKAPGSGGCTWSKTASPASGAQMILIAYGCALALRRRRRGDVSLFASSK